MTDEDADAGTLTVYANWSCSKCRGARALLEGHDTPVDYIEYLKAPLDRDELVRLLSRLGFDDPRSMMRTGDALFAELGLASAGRDELLQALVAHPALLERPIAVRGERAVIARPPERVLELLADDRADRSAPAGRSRDRA